MSTAELRKEIKRSIDQIPSDRLLSLAEFVGFLARPPVKDRIAKAEREFASGKGVPWRKVRQDV